MNPTTHRSLPVLLLAGLLAPLGAHAQSAPPRPAQLERFAWFGCDSLAVSGSTRVYGVPVVGAPAGPGGDIGSNGNITVGGNNKVQGNATPGPGKHVTVSGKPNQITGSTAPAAAALTCQDSPLADWTAWAQANNNNAALPAGTLDANRNFIRNGNTPLLLPAGLYHLRDFLVNGASRITLAGPVTLVISGKFTVNGNAALNAGGDPRNLRVILTGAGCADLNGSIAVSLQLYAPLSLIAVNSGFTGYGNLWGKSFTAGGSVIWNRVTTTGDTTPPAAPVIGHPADGALINDPRPLLAGTAEASSTVRLYDNGFTLAQAAADATGAWSLPAAAPFTDGSHRFTATSTDAAGNVSPASLPVTVTIDTVPPDTTITAGPPNPSSASSVNFVFVASELDGIHFECDLDGAPFAICVSPILATVTTDGPHRFQARAIDAAGNADPTPAVWQWTRDTAAPPAIIANLAPLPNSAGWNNADVTVTFTCTAGGAAIADCSAPVSVTVDGSNQQITGTATDTAGGTASVTVTVNLDKTPPAVLITGFDPAGWYNHSITPNIGVNDANLVAASVRIALDGQPFSAGSTVSDEGIHIVSVDADDLAGNHAQSLAPFAIDTTPPVITVRLPFEGQTVNASPALFSGSVNDAAPQTLSINGQAILQNGETEFTATPVAVTQGDNSVSLIATDRAGNTANTTVHVTLKTAPPQIAFTSPNEGTVTAEFSLRLSGTVSADAVSVKIGERDAIVASGRFFIDDFSVAEGDNAFVATALDAAGNSATATLHVKGDRTPPVLSWTTPLDGARTNQPAIDAAGTVSDISFVSLTLNGLPLQSSAGAFASAITLEDGANVLSLVATDAAGNATSLTRTVFKETAPLVVTAVTPTPDSLGVSTTANIDLRFSQALDERTLTDTSFSVAISGTPVIGTLVALGDRVLFLPNAPYPDDATVTVTLSTALKDLAGNSLVPFTAHFSTALLTGGGDTLFLTLSAYPALTKESSATLIGRSRPGALVSAIGGTSPATATADATGGYRLTVTLLSDALNELILTATRGGVTSNSLPATILQDSIGPVVTGFVIDNSGDLVFDFDEAIEGSSISPQSASLLLSGASIPLGSDLEAGGARLRLQPLAPIENQPAVISLSRELTDLAGNPLREPFRKVLNGAGAGDSFLEGEVFDDVTGLPLPGTSVERLSAADSPVISGVLGGWALRLPGGDSKLRLSAAGFSDAYRTVILQPGEIRSVLDVRLTPLSPDRKSVTSEGGSLAFAGGAITLAVPANAFAAVTNLTLTTLSAQGLPLPLPAGFSPLAAARLDLSSTADLPLTLSIPAPAATPSGTIPAALFNHETLQWIGLTNATHTADRLTVNIPASSAVSVTVAWLRLDTTPMTPSAVAEGIPLAGVPLEPLADATGVLVSIPSVILPDQKATSTVTLTPAHPFSSGVPFAVTFGESLDLTDGSTRTFSPFNSDLLGYQSEGQPTTLSAKFPVSPFPGIDLLTLLQGKIRLEVGPHSDAVLGGGILGVAGGRVDGAAGIRVELPAGATTNPLPVRLFPVSANTLLAPIPAGYAFLGGIDLHLGGQSLGAPAVLSLDASALPVSVASGDLVIVAELRTVAGLLNYLAIDLATLTTVEGKLRILSGNTSPAGLPWPQVTGEGRYVFLKAIVPTGFATGRILNDAAQPVAAAVVGLPAAGSGNATNAAPQPGTSRHSGATTASRTRIAAMVNSGKASPAALALLELSGLTFLSGNDGRYALPIPLTAASIQAVELSTGDKASATVSVGSPRQIVTRDLAIIAAPLIVLSTAPANNATGIPIGAEIVVTFSKLIDPLSLTNESVQVNAAGDPVSGETRLLTGASRIAFTPSAVLPAGVRIEVRVAGVRDRAGRTLAAPYLFAFTIQVPPVTKLEPGKIEAYLPDANGTITISGGPGAVEGNAVVALYNKTHPEHGTVTVNAASNGSFSVSIMATISDRLELHVFGADGGERVYLFKQYISTDHQSVSIGAEGGVFTSLTSSGAPLATIIVPEGAFDGAVILSIKPGDVAQMAPTPEEFVASPPVNFTVSSPSRKEIELIMPAPAGWNIDDPAKTFWLTGTVEVGGPNPRLAPMVIDIVSPVQCPSGYIGRCLLTHSLPFPGFWQTIKLQTLMGQWADWGFLSGQFASISGGSVLATSANSDFVFLLAWAITPTWTLPVRTVKPAGGYQLNFVDNQTGEVLVSATRQEPPNPGTPTDMGIFTDIKTRPYIMESTPFKSFPFQLRAVEKRPAEPVAVKFETQFTSAPDIRVWSEGGIAWFSGDPNHPSKVEITCGGRTGFAAVGPDGRFDFLLSKLHTSDLSGDVDIAVAIESGSPVTVTWPISSSATKLATLAKVPDIRLRELLRLKIKAGKLALVAEDKFGDPEAQWNLYNGMAAATTLKLKDNVKLNSTGGGELQLERIKKADDPEHYLALNNLLFYTLSVKDVDPATPITVNFDYNLLSAVKAVTEANKTSVGTQPNVRLLDTRDPQHVIAVRVDPDARRTIVVTPLTGLKPGGPYELRFANLKGPKGTWPANEYVAAQFSINENEEVGSLHYDRAYDFALRGSILYTAAGDDGIDIADVSDPTLPASVFTPPGPVHNVGTTRSVGIAEGVSICVPPSPTDTEFCKDEHFENYHPRTVAVFVGGGNDSAGFISLRYADFKADSAEDPNPQPKEIGEFISGATLSNRLATDTAGTGLPNVVRTVGTSAFVSTTGIGLQQVDLNFVAKKATGAILYQVDEWDENPGCDKVNDLKCKNGGYKHDISVNLAGIDTRQAGPTTGYVYGAVRYYGMLTWAASGAKPRQIVKTNFPSCARPDGGLKVVTVKDYEFTHMKPDGTLEIHDGSSAPGHMPKMNLALLASGRSGVEVFEDEDGGILKLINVIPTYDPPPPPTDPPTIPTPTGKGSTYDMAVDARRKLIYLANYETGVAIMDFSDPLIVAPLPAGDTSVPPAELLDCVKWQGKYGTTPYGKIDANKDGKDDRLLGVLANADKTRATLVVDSDTGLVYTGQECAVPTGSTSPCPASGLHIQGAQEPRLEFLLDDNVHPGQFVNPGYLSAVGNDKPRLAAWIPGGDLESGKILNQAKLTLFNKQGFIETPAKDAAKNPIRKTVERDVTLTRQSNKKTEAKYNFYVLSVADKIHLTTHYDPAASDEPELMVLASGLGSMRGEIEVKPWSKSNVRWGQHLKLDKPIYRPEIEWLSDQLIEKDVEGPTKETVNLNSYEKDKIPNLDGPLSLAQEQVRRFLFRLKPSPRRDGKKPTELRIAASTSSEDNNSKILVRKVGENSSGDVSFPLVGSEPVELKLEMEGRVTVVPDTQGQLPELKTVKVKFQLMYPGDPKPGTLVEQEIQVLKTGMAFDYNRDGEVCFPGEKESAIDSERCKKGNDKPEWVENKGIYKNYEFWLNDDYDDFNGNTGSPEDTRGNGYEQDDIDYRDMNADNEVRDKPDYEFNRLKLERDLEDFARLQLRRSPIPAENRDNAQYFLYFVSDDNPTIKVFKHPEVTVGNTKYDKGGEEYLRVPAVAQAMVCAHDLPSSGEGCKHEITQGTVRMVKRAIDEKFIPQQSLNLTAVMRNDKEKSFFLFEGMKRGKGTLVLEVRDDHALVARVRMPLRLEPVHKYFEEYTVGLQNVTNITFTPPLPFPMYYHDCGGLLQNLTLNCGDLEPQQEVKRYDPVNGETPARERDYILMVHGMNVGPFEKKSLAATTYKRLYWQGYQGRLGALYWPSNFSKIFGDWPGEKFGGVTYHLSELRGWQSGEGMANLLVALGKRGTLKGSGGDQSVRLHVFTHSQGNVMTSEALRIIAEEPELLTTDHAYSLPLVTSYFNSESAMHADSYFQNRKRYDPSQCPNGLEDVNRNDLCGDRSRFAPDGALVAALVVNSTSFPDYQFTRLNEGNERPWPNLYGYFPNRTFSEWKPYFGSVKNAVVGNRIFNYYNRFDNLTGQTATNPDCITNPDGCDRDPVIHGRRGAAWRLGQWVKAFNPVQHATYGFHRSAVTDSNLPSSVPDYEGESTNVERGRIYYSPDVITDPDTDPGLYQDQYISYNLLPPWICLILTASHPGCLPFQTPRIMDPIRSREDRYQVFAFLNQGYMGTVGATPGLFGANPNPGTPVQTLDRDVIALADFTGSNKLEIRRTPYLRASRVYHSIQWRNFLSSRALFWQQMMFDMGKVSPEIDQDRRLPVADHQLPFER